MSNLILYTTDDSKSQIQVRELFSLSNDYDKTYQATQTFFATVQNLLLYAVSPRSRCAGRFRVEGAGKNHQKPAQAMTEHHSILYASYRELFTHHTARVLE